MKVRSLRIPQDIEQAIEYVSKVDEFVKSQKYSLSLHGRGLG